jgi:hypothetical protein
MGEPNITGAANAGLWQFLTVCFAAAPAEAKNITGDYTAMVFS